MAILQATTSSSHELLSKVPQVTALFWLTKIFATTFGETAGDAVSMSLNLGYRVVTNPDIAVMAANAKSILFGDFGKYMIRDVMGLTLYRFDDSAYAKLGQVGFLAWSRAGGNLIDNGGAVKYYQNSST